MTQSLDDRILAVVRELLDDLGSPAGRIDVDASLRDLGIDSLHAVDLIFRFEEAFDITIPMEDFHATTVGEAMAFLKALLERRDGKAPATAAD